MPDFKKSLRFYFITDDQSPVCPAADQADIALKAGATIIQYRHKSFSLGFFEEARQIREQCERNGVPFIVNDNVLLAKALMADGVHLGQEDDDPEIARDILGADAIIGMSVSGLDELEKTDLQHCDYVGTGAVFPTHTKHGKDVCGLSGLKAVVEKSRVPVVAIGGINSENAVSCFVHGASGIAVISFVSRADDPLRNAMALGSACGCKPRT